MPSASGASIPLGITSRAALAGLPVLRKADLPALHKAAPPFGGFVREASWLVWAAVYVARSDLRARARSRRPLARRAGAVRGRVPPGRCGAEHLQLSSDARRLHLRCLGARAGLRGDPGRPRQYRGAIRADRGLSPGRLLRHPRFPQDPARCGRQPPAATSPRSSARWYRARRFRNRCRRRSSRAASMPIRRSAPPISA